MELNGISDIEGKAAREAASELGSERVSMELNGISDIEHVAIGNEAFGESDIEGKAGMGSGESGGKRSSFNRADRRQRSWVSWRKHGAARVIKVKLRGKQPASVGSERVEVSSHRCSRCP
jgi:hypothetical protein